MNEEVELTFAADADSPFDESHLDSSRHTRATYDVWHGNANIWPMTGSLPSW
jgi:hypothetical protein